MKAVVMHCTALHCTALRGGGGRCDVMRCDARPRGRGEREHKVVKSKVPTAAVSRGRHLYVCVCVCACVCVCVRVCVCALVKPERGEVAASNGPREPRSAGLRVLGYGTLAGLGLPPRDPTNQPLSISLHLSISLSLALSRSLHTLGPLAIPRLEHHLAPAPVQRDSYPHPWMDGMCRLITTSSHPSRLQGHILGSSQRSSYVETPCRYAFTDHGGAGGVAHETKPPHWLWDGCASARRSRATTCPLSTKSRNCGSPWNHPSGKHPHAAPQPRRVQPVVCPAVLNLRQAGRQTDTAASSATGPRPGPASNMQSKSPGLLKDRAENRIY
ncbi:hypothetical protein IWX47DRAFT_12578 [Phyllosticta citricarpa]